MLPAKRCNEAGASFNEHDLNGQLGWPLRTIAMNDNKRGSRGSCDIVNTRPFSMRLREYHSASKFDTTTKDGFA